MTTQPSKDPLHGVTLEMQVTALVARYGWAGLGKIIKINCFNSDPSVKSSLKFLRRTPWARAEVEALYLDSLDDPAPAADDEDATSPWARARADK
ncbi:MAG: VF530 family DNA-binding protein [Silvania sp.]|uniref:VF530 family protein n=1 Tax=Silvania sp. TaxID=3016633 RepID=UPI000FBF01CA